MIIEALIIALLFGIASAVVGSGKGAAFQGFFLGLLLGPLGLIISFVMKGDRKPCPKCFELISPAATKCPKCASAIGIPVAELDSTHLANDEMKKCPSCAEMIKLEAIKCRYCGVDFDSDAVAQEIRALEEKQAKAIENLQLCPFCKKPGLYYDFNDDLFCPHCQKLVTAKP